MVAERVGQFEVLVIGHPALNTPHLLEGVAQLGQEGLQLGVLQVGDVQQTGGQLDVVVRQLLVGGRHLVRPDASVLQLTVVPTKQNELI